MRVERIELENWMSYPRVWQDVTGECRPAIDLSGHPLILIAGENGAGKSAILEAICYALFAKYPRGNANNEAIRSSEKKAIIRLYFSIPGHKENTIYCVERELRNED